MKKIICVVCRGRKSDCVACNGTGKINPPKPKNYKKDTDGAMKSAATIMRDYGYTLREIAETLGYKNPQSIQWLLEKSPQPGK